MIGGGVVGAVGGALFVGSLPGEKGSPEARAAGLEVDLKRARNRITALEAAHPDRARGPGAAFTRSARQLAQDFRDGGEIDPNDLFRTLQPAMREIAPFYDRIRMRTAAARADSLSGEMIRRYELPEADRTRLRIWFGGREKQQAERWNALVAREGTTLTDLARAAGETRPDDGLDEFMEGVLDGEKLADFRTRRLAEKAARVQADADRQVQRLDGIVALDDAQRDRAFAMAARESRDFEPGMRFEGIDAAAAEPGGGTIFEILRPEQRQLWEEERDRRRTEAEKDMEAIGMKLPADWDLTDDDDFR